MAKILFTPSARAQIISAINYIQRENREAARRFRRRVETVLRRLNKFPDSGRQIPEFPSLPHREDIVAPYRFFYRAVGKKVWIVAVWHGAQLPEVPENIEGV
ncbi:MAG: type II toxin-antitoxin system RelE/ParE family toxin [Deltaproteobacteria bacterium]|nr:type II toxin-antitoxin system RelE/ParE family toxin [Deltaproteobacteria bacterium]